MPRFPARAPRPPPPPARLGADVTGAHAAEPPPGESRAAASGSDAPSAEIRPPPPPGIFQTLCRRFFRTFRGGGDLR